VNGNEHEELVSDLLRFRNRGYTMNNERGLLVVMYTITLVDLMASLAQTLHPSR